MRRDFNQKAAAHPLALSLPMLHTWMLAPIPVPRVSLLIKKNLNILYLELVWDHLIRIPPPDVFHFTCVYKGLDFCVR